ncbi:MAG: hypothetical protein ACOX0Z_02120 [Candidatus Nanosyncoccaceae bacterium]|jgi:hypothetical protein
MIRAFLTYSSSKNRRRDLASKIVYIALNIALVASIAISLIVFSSIWLAISLLVLSKWRVFAVKPRFWWANMQSNAVDFIVGLGYIVYLSQIPLGSYISQGIVTVLYIFWLLIVKPRSSRVWVVVQGLAAMYMGVSSLLIIGSDWPQFLVLGPSILVCFIAQRHILAAHDIENVNYYAALGAMISGEVMWVLGHWVVSYNLPLKGLYLVQPAIILVLLMIVVELVIESILNEPEKSGAKTKSGWLDDLRPVLLPIGLCLITVLILMIFFTKPLVGNI